MFGTTHIIYTVISLIVSALLIFLGKKFIKSENGHNRALWATASITVLLHISPLWVDYLRTGEALVESPMLFPIYPCNVCMWLLLALTYMKREGVLYRLTSEFVCLGGTVCGIIGLVFNANFAANPTLADWGIFKGLLSHSTMILGTVYLGVCGFVKIRLRNILSVMAGLCFFVLDGALINGIYALAGLEPCNSMYLLEPPFASMPWLTTPLIGALALVIVVALTVLYERFALKKKCKEIFTLKNLIDFS